MARILRRVLRNASYHGLLSENTLLLLQGDLNSRTVLVDGVKDILKEVMADTKLQAAIRHSLPVPEAWPILSEAVRVHTCAFEQNKRRIAKGNGSSPVVGQVPSTCLLLTNSAQRSAPHSSKLTATW
eukprot:g12977.t1